MTGPRRQILTNEQKRAGAAIRRASVQSKSSRARYERAVRDGLNAGLSLRDAADFAEVERTSIRYIRDKP